MIDAMQPLFEKLIGAIHIARKARPGEANPFGNELPLGMKNSSWAKKIKGGFGKGGWARKAMSAGLLAARKNKKGWAAKAIKKFGGSRKILGKAGAIGSALATPTAMFQQAIEAIKFLKSVGDAAESQFHSLQSKYQASASIGILGAERKISDTFRSMNQGEQLADSAKYLNDAVTNFKDASSRFDVGWEKAKNYTYGFAANAAAMPFKMGDTLADIVSGKSDVGSQSWFNFMKAGLPEWMGGGKAYAEELAKNNPEEFKKWQESQQKPENVISMQLDKMVQFEIDDARHNDPRNNRGGRNPLNGPPR